MREPRAQNKETHKSSNADNALGVFHSLRREAMKPSHESLNIVREGETLGGTLSSWNGKTVPVMRYCALSVPIASHASMIRWSSGGGPGIPAIRAKSTTKGGALEHGGKIVAGACQRRIYACVQRQIAAYMCTYTICWTETTAQPLLRVCLRVFAATAHRSIARMGCATGRCESGRDRWV